MRSQVVRTEMSYRSYNQSQMSSSYGVSPLVRWNTRGLVNLTLLETFVVFDLTVYMVVHPSPGTKVEVVRQNEETNGFYITQLPYRLLEIDTRLTATFCFVFASLHQDPRLTCVIR